MRFKRPLSLANMMLNRVEVKFKRTHLLSRPIEVMLEPTIGCNSNCVMCTKRFLRTNAKSPDGFLSWDTLWKIKPFFKYAERVLFSGFGEPLLHPEYLAMVKEIKRSGPFVYLYTNGTLLTEEIGKGLTDAGMDRICISISGATRETYHKIRGIDAFETVINNVNEINEYKKRTGKRSPLLSFNVVAMNTVLPELEALVQLAHEIGVEDMALPNLIVQSEPMREESPWKDIEKAEKAFQKAKDLAQKLCITFWVPRLEVYKKNCTDIFRISFITWNGKVLSCAQERYMLGDLNENSLASIWNSDLITQLRKDYYDKGLEARCQGCPCFENSPESFLNSRINSREYAIKIT